MNKVSLDSIEQSILTELAAHLKPAFTMLVGEAVYMQIKTLQGLMSAVRGNYTLDLRGEVAWYVQEEQGWPIRQESWLHNRRPDRKRSTSEEQRETEKAQKAKSR